MQWIVKLTDETDDETIDFVSDSRLGVLDLATEWLKASPEGVCIVNLLIARYESVE